MRKTCCLVSWATLKHLETNFLSFLGDFYLAFTLCEIKMELMGEGIFGIALKFVEELKNAKEGSCYIYENFFLDPRFKYAADDPVFNLKRQQKAIVSF